MNKALIISLFVLSGVSGVQPGLAQTPGIEQKVIFENTVHFFGSDGVSVPVPAGSYQVEVADTFLQLRQEEGSTLLTIAAQPTTHEEAISTMEAMVVAEGEDEWHLVVLAPNGQGLEAIGSSSGVQTRGVKGLSRQKLRQSWSQRRNSSSAPGKKTKSPPSKRGHAIRLLPKLSSLSPAQVKQQERQRKTRPSATARKRPNPAEPASDHSRTPRRA